MDEHKVDFAALDWQSPGPGVRQKVHEKDGHRLRLVVFSREFSEGDWCRKGHLGYVLQGELEIDFNGIKVRYGTGDGLCIPAGKAHRHKAAVLGQSVRLILVDEA
ncbi:MAG: cupin domain-containing protein [Proteobacteria bacterium]|nr:cupin domain-containing protein [Pseudomonadota bacterium]MBU4276593.1 cupin domain-containing protein [Pseudomonadota bacterium]MBU4382194.1 cupin domain-containing protein [Pseudomonadota bacterium]MCG2765860.1 cupin domain-containing protein [Desulfarculaceae bacterium]